MLKHDYELANESFSKAQLVDPEYSIGWFGQALIAETLGSAESAELFEHAYSLNPGATVIEIYSFIILYLFFYFFETHQFLH